MDMGNTSREERELSVFCVCATETGHTQLTSRRQQTQTNRRASVLVWLLLRWEIMRFQRCYLVFSENRIWTIHTSEFFFLSHIYLYLWQTQFAPAAAAGAFAVAIETRISGWLALRKTYSDGSFDGCRGSLRQQQQQALRWAGCQFPFFSLSILQLFCQLTLLGGPKKRPPTNKTPIFNVNSAQQTH